MWLHVISNDIRQNDDLQMLKYEVQGVPASYGAKKVEICKMVYISSSARNLGHHWIISLKIKSYYQTLVLWSKLDQEKGVLFCKNGTLFSNPGQFYVSSSVGNQGCHWIIGLKIKSYYETLAF